MLGLMDGEPRELVWDSPTGPFRVMLDHGVFVPSSTSREVAEGLIVHPGETVIDVGCGSGVLSFVAARLGASTVYGTDVNPQAIELAGLNAERLGLAGRVQARLGSLFEPVDGIQANVVIGDVSGVPDEIASVSDWFPGGYSGGARGAEGPAALLRNSAGRAPPRGGWF